MAESKNDRARRRRDAVAAAVAAKKKIDAAVADRQAAKSKVQSELDKATEDLSKAEGELAAATRAAVASGALVPGDTIVADGYVVCVTTTRGNRTTVSVRRAETGPAPKRPGRGGKAKTTDGSEKQQQDGGHPGGRRGRGDQAADEGEHGVADQGPPPDGQGNA